VRQVLGCREHKFNLGKVYKQYDEMDVFHVPNPSSRNMVLGSTQTLTEMSTTNLPEG
jgi:hypothetical protein